VTLIDMRLNPGGVCLFQGCIPSKALLHVARLMNEARDAAAWGLLFAPPTIDLEKMRGWKEGVVAKLTSGLGLVGKQRHVTFLEGRARLVDAHTVEVAREGGGVERLSLDYGILATGSAPAQIPGFPVGPHIWDSTAALELREVPPSLLVIGGGYIGLELGSVYAALGSKVTLVEAMPGLLPGADRDLVSHLQRRILKSFQAIHVSTKVEQLAERDQGVLAKLVGVDVADPNPRFDRVLVAVGRKPLSRDLGLENTRVQLDPRGFVQVDAQRRTAEPNWFAIGDVAGEPMLAHKATYEGRIAAEAIAGRPSAYDPKAIPAVVFTDPELAWAGLTEAQARTEGRDVKIAKFPWSASGRATTMGRNDGLTKMVIDAHDERLLGVGIVGVGAGEMIAEAVLAIEMGAQATDLMLTIHAHPTLSETLMEAAEVHFGHSPSIVAKSNG
jgi:dihydrolipoamide dehydrogenase